jgi:single-strand DNA-binding protein
MDLNRAMIIGNLTRDPEIRTTTTGRNVASFSLATNRYWTDASGQKQTQVEYHNIVLWAKLADVAGQYMHKGDKAYIEGRLQTRDWTAQDGTKRTRTEIVGESLIMLGGRGGNNVAGQTVSTPAVGQNVGTTEEVIEEEVRVEDIPF